MPGAVFYSGCLLIQLQLPLFLKPFIKFQLPCSHGCRLGFGLELGFFTLDAVALHGKL